MRRGPSASMRSVKTTMKASSESERSLRAPVQKHSNSQIGVGWQRHVKGTPLGGTIGTENCDFFSCDDVYVFVTSMTFA